MINVHYHGVRPYLEVWQEMKSFTINRNESTIDELWVLEHPPVYTQGQAGKDHHILNTSNIPVVKSDRGGQVTYHGPGQLVAYTLLDIKRLEIGVRELVCKLEDILIHLLCEFNINAQKKCGAPGVYVGDKKIASIGLRVKNGCTYHGIALNVAMNLEPFKGINPCGYDKLKMTQMQEFVNNININDVNIKFIKIFTDAMEIYQG